ncbi:MAG: THUMP domain-containing protein [Desulfococcaceae bacterium]|jgi:putative N6-adenine-specific DNA methylase|nr:THUMP domain-containing protein [Desulfococcaceae bacterium]
MLLYQKERKYFAQIAGGMEEAGAAEIKALGAESVETAIRGIHFRATKACLCRINYLSRFLTRVLAPLLRFDCPDADTLYRKTQTLSWPDILGPENTFALFSNVSHSHINHSHYASLRVKDAIADQFRERFGKRPSVDTKEPDIWINLHIRSNSAVLSLDTSGGSLHRRGYRKEGLEAPLQETLAAAIIRLSEWDGSRPLADPMCGSGTLLNEALMQYCRIPAGYLRARFGFEFLPDFDAAIWRSVKKKEDRKIGKLPQGLISGSDISARAVQMAEKNSRRLPEGEGISYRRSDFRNIPNLENTVIVCNPPYGIRLENPEVSGKLMKDFGDFLKQKCKGSSAYIYFGERELIKKIGLKPAWKKELRNGRLDGRLVRYDLY